MPTSQSRMFAEAGVKRTVAPTIRAIEIADLKRHARIDSTSVAEITSALEYILAATDYVQDEQNRCLLSSTWQAVYDSFPPCGVFYMPRPPLIAVSSITYLDSSGASQTLSTDYYTVDNVSEPGRVALKYGQSWPSTYQQQGAVTVTFTAGYASGLLVPAQTRQAIRIVAGHWYENREPVVVGASVASVPISAAELIQQHKFLGYR